MTVAIEGSRASCSRSMPRDAYHLYRVLDARGPQPRGVEHAVAQRQHVVGGIEVPRLGIEIDRGHCRADNVHRVQALLQPDEVAAVLMAARPPAALEVRTIRRATDARKRQVWLAINHVPLGVAGVQLERSGHLRRRFRDQSTIEPHALRSHVYGGACTVEDLERPVVQHLHADLFQHAQAGVMDSLDLVGAEHLDRR
jgi:hypothetical protein